MAAARKIASGASNHHLPEVSESHVFAQLDGNAEVSGAGPVPAGRPARPIRERQRLSRRGSPAPS
jgi:hypothetical protein